MPVFGYYSSPIGLLEIACSEIGIAEISVVDRPRHETPDSPPDALRICIAQLDEYFNGRRKRFDVPLDLRRGTDFYREVWRLVQAIPYGRTRSYSTIAETLGRPHANRAVGQANGRNPLPIIIPCHRVIGKDGALTGYAYGLEMKEALLALENPEKFAHQAELW